MRCVYIAQGDCCRVLRERLACFDRLVAWAIWLWRVSWKLSVADHIFFYILDFFWQWTTPFVREFHSNLYTHTVRISGESPCVGWWLWCGSGGKCTVGWTKGLLLVENSMTHQRVTLLHRLKTSSSWEYRVVSAPVLCTVGVVIMFCIESHWIHQDTWKTIVCCLFRGSEINAFRMACSNTAPAAKSCACAYIAFLAAIFSWYADSTRADARVGLYLGGGGDG
jgi:hypothetical protein